MTLSKTEISSLRAELSRYADNVVDLAKFAIAATSGLIGLGLSAQRPAAGYIVLVPLLILWSFLSLAMNRQLNIMRIAAYLRAFAGEEFKYESRLWEIRQRREIPRVGYHSNILGIFIAAGFVCVALSVFLLAGEGVLLAVPGTAGMFWVVFSIAWWMRSRRMVMGGELDMLLFNVWSGIERGETADRLSRSADHWNKSLQ